MSLSRLCPLSLSLFPSFSLSRSRSFLGSVRARFPMAGVIIAMAIAIIHISGVKLAKVVFFAPATLPGLIRARARARMQYRVIAARDDVLRGRATCNLCMRRQRVDVCRAVLRKRKQGGIFDLCVSPFFRTVGRKVEASKA